jgi:hypothetical protein
MIEMLNLSLYRGSMAMMQDYGVQCIFNPRSKRPRATFTKVS